MAVLTVMHPNPVKSTLSVSVCIPAILSSLQFPRHPGFSRQHFCALSPSATVHSHSLNLVTPPTSLGLKSQDTSSRNPPLTSFCLIQAGLDAPLCSYSSTWCPLLQQTQHTQFHHFSPPGPWERDSTLAPLAVPHILLKVDPWKVPRIQGPIKKNKNLSFRTVKT